MAILIRSQSDAQRADERRRSAQHGGVRSIGWLYVLFMDDLLF